MGSNPPWGTISRNNKIMEIDAGQIIVVIFVLFWFVLFYNPKTLLIILFLLFCEFIFICLGIFSYLRLGINFGMIFCFIFSNILSFLIYRFINDYIKEKKLKQNGDT